MTLAWVTVGTPPEGVNVQAPRGVPRVGALNTLHRTVTILQSGMIRLN